MKHKPRLVEKSNLPKKILGLLLLVVLIHFIFTNFSLDDWPKIGMMLKGESKTCIEIKGPKVMTDTIIEQLKVDDIDFKVMRNENRAIITIENKDNRTGDVRVLLYCRNGDEQGEQSKTIRAGESEVFSFIDINDCDLDYIIEPDTIHRRVNRTVYVSNSVCE